VPGGRSEISGGGRRIGQLPANVTNSFRLFKRFVKISESSSMFWKIALGLGVVGVVLGLIIFIVSFWVMRTATDDGSGVTPADVALGFFLFSIVLTIGSVLLIAVSLIFVLRASKKEFEAKKAA
jgi:uncharacterized membrane protein